MTTPRRQPTESSPLLGRSTDSLGSYSSVDDEDSSSEEEDAVEDDFLNVDGDSEDGAYKQ